MLQFLSMTIQTSGEISGKGPVSRNRTAGERSCYEVSLYQVQLRSECSGVFKMVA